MIIVFYNSSEFYSVDGISGSYTVDIDNQQSKKTSRRLLGHFIMKVSYNKATAYQPNYSCSSLSSSRKICFNAPGN